MIEPKDGELNISKPQVGVRRRTILVPEEAPEAERQAPAPVVPPCPVHAPTEVDAPAPAAEPTLVEASSTVDTRTPVDTPTLEEIPSSTGTVRYPSSVASSSTTYAHKSLHRAQTPPVPQEHIFDGYQRMSPTMTCKFSGAYQMANAVSCEKLRRHNG